MNGDKLSGSLGIAEIGAAVLAVVLVSFIVEKSPMVRLCGKIHYVLEDARGVVLLESSLTFSTTGDVAMKKL